METLNDVVDRDFRALPPNMGARFARICELIVTAGLECMAYRMYAI